MAETIDIPTAESAVDSLESPQEIWDNLRLSLPKLEPSAQRASLQCFPSEFRLDFKSPCLFICAHSIGKCDLKFDEALHITVAAIKNTLHESFVQVGDHQFLITTVKPFSFYGRSTDPKRDAGIVVIRLTKLVIICVFSRPHLMPQITSQVELLGELLRKEGL